MWLSGLLYIGSYFLLDYGLQKIIEDHNCRFFVIHSATNVMLTVGTIADTYDTLLDPINCMTGYSSKWPLLIVQLFHLCHMINSYSYLNSIDWIHHLVSVGCFGLPAMFYEMGPLRNFIIFFMCGLPGAIDYAMLSLVKLNYLSPLTEKKINCYLNNWIRSPGIILFGSFLYISNLVHQRLWWPILMFYITLGIVNGIYFSQRVTFNYGYVSHRQRLQ